MRTRLTLATLALTLAAAGCGGDDGDSSDGPSTPEQAIEASLRTLFTTDDDENCTRLATAGLVRRTYGSVEKCRGAGRRSANARSIDVERVRASSARASARVTPTGSDLDGQDFDVRLRRVGGDWRLDAIGLPKNQRAELRQGLTAGLRSERYSARVQRCTLRRLTGAVRRLDVVDYASDESDLPKPFQRRLEKTLIACNR
ncbi:hypothetical protein [Patulibacter minatonensis]|uniref:hypothetical protein n=1 Tax=Patulibacter minatonensis TaxID=298163 RepID=UPI00047CD60C|nr:hypothetical protein [Patulibacter minatonensis]